MSKTVDDLVRLYEEHRNCKKLDPKAHAMRVVVTALRDEFTKLGTLEFQDSWAVLKKFEEILAPREGGRREAGGPTREDGRTTEAGFDSLPADVGPSTPAAPAPTVGQRLIKAAHEAAAIARGDMQPGRVHAAPAPDVCVWVPDVQFRDAFSTGCGYVARKRPAGSPCICAKPIKFKTEAQR